MRKKPSKKQIQTLRFIEEFTRLYGLPPTMQEIAENFGVKPPSIYQQIVLLEKRGLVERSGQNRARNIRLTEAGMDQLLPVQGVLKVAIRGRVAAGSPFFAEDNVLGHLHVDETLARRGELFALEVSGDSMVDVGIKDGDYVIVRQQPVAETGDIVVALLSTGATVKRLHIDRDRIELRPECKRHRPIDVSQDHEFQIAGKVLSVQHVVKRRRR
jgi:repressor LexA